jgi:hypothetical protein
MTLTLRPSERSYLDTESRAMIFQGCSVNQLAEIFGMKTPDVMRRLAGLDPVGVGRQGNPIYRLKDAAARLVKIPITAEMIDQYMKRTNGKDLPPFVNKLYWEGVVVREKYREQAGELWTTADVSQVAADAFQSLRMSVLLIPDALVNDTDLNERQMKIVQAIIDNALEESREKLVGHLSKPSGGRSAPEDNDEL